MKPSYILAIIITLALLYILPLFFKLIIGCIAVGVGYLIWSGHDEMIIAFGKDQFTKLITLISRKLTK